MVPFPTLSEKTSPYCALHCLNLAMRQLVVVGSSQQRRKEMGCYLLLEKFWIDGEVRISNDRQCRWAWGKMLLATAKAQQFDDDVEETQRRACPEIRERICSNNHDARWCSTVLDSCRLCCTQKAKKNEYGDCFLDYSETWGICMSAIDRTTVMITLHTVVCQ